MVQTMAKDRGILPRNFLRETKVTDFANSNLALENPITGNLLARAWGDGSFRVLS